jgi:6-pyruvoyltetrahydropterin/6-carboxytetrahydropterin synthase
LEPDPVTGFVVNLQDVSRVMNEAVVSKADHKNLNVDVPFMRGIQPSTENFAVAIWNEIVDPIRALGGELHCVKVQETENNFVEYFGETKN